jgi:hypothetical protein
MNFAPNCMWNISKSFALPNKHVYYPNKYNHGIILFNKQTQHQCFKFVKCFKPMFHLYVMWLWMQDDAHAHDFVGAKCMRNTGVLHMACARRKIGSENHFGCTWWYHLVTRLKWNSFQSFQRVLILMQDRCMICVERTIGSEVVFDAPDRAPRWQGSRGISLLFVWRQW